MSAQTWSGRRRESKAAADQMHAWESERRCSVCGVRLIDSEHGSHHVAFRGRDGISREWNQLSVEGLATALESSPPLCWDCHVAETFRREHPELVTDRDFGGT